MRNTVQLCFAANDVLLSVIENHALVWKCQTPARQPLPLPELNNYEKQTRHGDWMIKQLLNSVIAKYRDLSVSRDADHDILLNLVQ